MPMNPRLLRPTATANFRGGDLALGSLYEAALEMVKGRPVSPTPGGTLNINGQSLGAYDYAIRSGETLSSFTAADWFTATEDARSAWCVVRGDLTINSGVTFTPSVRKLFTVLVVTGNLTVNGAVSMTARGANHSGTGNSGGATTAAAIRIINGTYSGVSDPQVPASGGAGAPNISTNGAGIAGSAGSAGGCGGGGSGAVSSGGPAGINGGSAGTSFSGGSGGGSKAGGNIASPGGANGGAGGSSNGVFSNSGGGAGNPGGIATGNNAVSGSAGTGGVLIVIVLGSLSGSGSIAANGSAGGNSPVPGGGSGGGSVTVLAKTDVSSITPAANGGSGGGAGGAGTARKLAI